MKAVAAPAVWGSPFTVKDLKPGLTERAQKTVGFSGSGDGCQATFPLFPPKLGASLLTAWSWRLEICCRLGEPPPLLRRVTEVSEKRPSSPDVRLRALTQTWSDTVSSQVTSKSLQQDNVKHESMKHVQVVGWIWWERKLDCWSKGKADIENNSLNIH